MSVGNLNFFYLGFFFVFCFTRRLLGLAKKKIRSSVSVCLTQNGRRASCCCWPPPPPLVFIYFSFARLFSSPTTPTAGAKSNKQNRSKTNGESIVILCYDDGLIIINFLWPSTWNKRRGRSWILSVWLYELMRWTVTDQFTGWFHPFWDGHVEK